MTESGPTTRRRARIAIVALLGVLFALLPATAAQATGSISVTFPSNAGVTWTAGTTQQVSWLATGLTGSVKLELYKGGSLATPTSLIKASVPASAGSYNWPIPVNVVPGADYKVKVSSADGTVLNQSANDFTINAPTATVTSPNGTESVALGSKRPITWNLPIPGNVMIELYDGSIYKTIKASTPASVGTFNWDVPVTQATGTTFKVRVSAVGNAGINDSSDATFTITNPTSTVSAPTASDSWMAGTKHDITWTMPIPGNVRLDLVANGSPYKVIKASLPASVGKFNWDIPLTYATGTQYQVQVSSVANNQITAISAASFDITYPSITAVTPSSGTITAGGKQTVAWSPSTTTGNVKLELIGGATPLTIKASVPASAATFSWDVPVTLSSSTAYSVKVTSLTQPLITAQSGTAFTVGLPSPTVTAPGNAVAWVAGTTQQVKWTFASPGNVKIDLYKGGVFKSAIKASVPASAGSFSWTIPLSLAQGTDYSIKVTSLVNTSLVGTGPAAFTINLPTITVTTPSGPFVAGTKNAIAWSSVAGSVKIDYTTDGGTNYSVIRSSVAGSPGTFTWDVPINIATGTTFEIRVSSTANLAGITGSTSTFTINPPTITVSLPANNATLSKASLSTLINWTTTGPLSGNVKIDLIGTGGKLLKSSIAASVGSFTWVFGTQAIGTYTIKVSSLSRTSVYDQVSITLTP